MANDKTIHNENAAFGCEGTETLETAGTTDKASMAELSALCRQYAGVFGLMAHLCNKEVDQELLETLMGNLYPLSSGNQNVTTSSRLIAGYLSKTWEGVIDDLAADYTATFIGHGSDGHSAAYPFESTYTSSKRLLMQGARTEVLAIYRSQGLDKQETWRNSEDHISIEFEFIQRIFIRAANAFKKGDLEHAEIFCTTLRNFITVHPLAWVPMMAAEMRNFAKTDFYRGLSFMLVGYLQLAEETLSELLGITAQGEAVFADDDLVLDMGASLGDVASAAAGQ